jgi:hypothetical protein
MTIAIDQWLAAKTRGGRCSGPLIPLLHYLQGHNLASRLRGPENVSVPGFSILNTRKP